VGTEAGSDASAGAAAGAATGPGVAAGPGAGVFRIVVLASGGGTNLQAILDRAHQRDAGEVAVIGAAGDGDGIDRAAASDTNGVRVEVVGVASDKPGAQALERARNAGVETAIFPAGEFGDRAARDAALADWIEARQADLVVLAGYMQLLSAEFVRRFAGRAINIHPALLPSFPGLDAIGQALDYGVAVTGVTVHFVDEGVDSGPVLAQRAIAVPEGRDRERLEEAIHAAEHELLPAAIGLIAAGRVALGPGRTVTITPA